MDTKRLAILGLLPLVLAACGDSDTPTTQARLLDGAVEGVKYAASPSALSGSTAADGSLECKAGDTITFTLGGVEIGKAACNPLISMSDLAGTSALSEPKLQNRLVFLQTLDEDDDPTNGIRIKADVAAALAGKAIDFTKASADFKVALEALLPDLKDAYDRSYKEREINDERRSGALEHYESTLASLLGKGSTASTVDNAGQTVAITKHQLQADKSLFLPYEGSNLAAKKDFPNGFYPAVGSGLAFKGVAADGSLEFWGITDRGPNGDSPNAPNPVDSVVGATKVFTSPSFAPSIGVIRINASSGAVLTSLMPLKSALNTKISGRPLPFTSVGSSMETPLSDALVYDGVKGAFDVNGLDPESLVFDKARNAFWTSDEYGPFIVKIGADTGVIAKRYAPGTAKGDLPSVLQYRRANRGMEGLTMAADGKLHGFLQSPIDPIVGGKSVQAVDSSDMDGDGLTTDKVNVKDFAQLARWVEFDPATETSKLYAYPLNFAVPGQKWDRNRTGSAKLGDVVALGGGKFLVIEQGADSSGAVRNFLMLVEVPANVTDIANLGYELEQNSIDGTTAVATTWANVVKLKKTMLLDMNAAGWKAEKAEGLALVDANTVAVMNDSDFGLRTILVDAKGNEISGDPTKCVVDAAGKITNAKDGTDCPGSVAGVRVTRGNEIDRHTRIWLFKFPRALSAYTVQ